MDEHLDRAVAVVGVGAIMPDAPDAAAFWDNIKGGRYSITDVDPARWDPQLYYDPDPKAPDKSYSKIGGWVRDWVWDPRGWKLPIMPRVADAIDDTQKWAVACTQQALSDYGYPERPLDNERVAVILGNAMAGELHYQTSLRINIADIAEELHETPSFRALANDVQRAITDELLGVVGKRYPEITEDTMPGELSNCIAGRVANLFNFRGPNFVIDAACASAMAATNSAVEGLIQGDFDAVIAGGIDRNMGAATYVKFCKVGALSATGTRPYAAGADGFVMGEGGAVFLLKRLRDANQAGDRIYAVLLGLAGSSDGRGKGITAPNPVGQKLAVQRAWGNAGVPPETASMVEGHGTSTPVGDVVEHQSMADVFGASGAAPGSIALGSVKSNIGHLKGAAGAAGMFKTVMSLHEKVIPPSLNFRSPNPNIDFSRSPFRVNTELREWERPEAGVRRAGVSAFGFGGTNFHAVFEEYVPERADGDAKTFAVPEMAGSAVTADVGRPAARADSPGAASPGVPSSSAAPGPKAPLRGAAVVGAATESELGERLAALAAEAAEGRLPPMAPPAAADLRAPERVAIDFGSAEELADKAAKAQRALTAGEAAWRMFRGRGVYRGRGPAPKVAFLYTGQGSQYPNMLRTLAEHEPRVAEVFEEADRIMTPLLQGRPLRAVIFVDEEDPAALAKAEEELRQTEITQPAVLTVDHALTRLLDAYGVRPDFVMGHSLGEYGALTAAGALPFEDALEAVSARGREMAHIDIEDQGLMAAVFAPLAEVERIVGEIDGNVVIANINSNRQAVIGGATEAVQRAMAALTDAGHQVMQLPVSHAFHTSIVAPASEPLKAALTRLRLRSASIPVVANVSGDFYPMGPDARPEMLDILGRQVASPVQFVKGLHTLYEHGARVFVEVGPKKSLHGFTEDVLGDEPDVLALFTNHPKWEDDVAFNQALCGLYASGLGTSAEGTASLSPPPAIHEYPPGELAVADAADDRAGSHVNVDGKGAGSRRPVVVSGAALGLPGTERLFDASNVGRILRGEQLISAIPADLRDAILDQHITRLVKAPDGGGSFEAIDDAADVIKLAGRAQAFDPEADFGIDGNRLPALDSTTCMAIAAGLDALNDAGIPLVQHYKTTTTGTQLPERWGLPDELRDDTGVIFASAFPGMDSFAGYAHDYYSDKARREQRAALESVRETVVAANGVGATPVLAELDRRLADLRAEIDAHPYEFDRRFLFRVLSMGHSQFAEIIGARGPNTQVNAACASTTQAIGLAEDWIRAGRCRRVIVIAADNVTSDNLLGWVGAGFLVTGAAATDEVVEDAATPFDLRRHGMILGMGAAAIVVEERDAVAERGIRPIAEVLSAVINNSAFHGTRLDVDHISQVMEHLVAQAEERWGIDRRAIAAETMFVSHETYTPARGGSAAAEVASLRAVFGTDAGQIVMANTKGFTGHPMGVGIEDVVAIKALETGLVPPIPNFKEPDPDLGELNLSVGGSYPARYALRLAAGFGSQISMVLFRWVPSPDGSRRSPEELGYEYRIEEPARWKGWLARVSGNPDPEVELVQHRLRVVDTGPAQTEPVDAPTTTVPRDDHAIPAPAAPAPEAPTVAAPVVVAVSEDEVRQRVLALVAAQTGYPEDMLDLDLDLEADLGVDTVKQAELFATVREVYGIAREDTLQLRDFPTLNHVIAFALDRAGAPAPAETAVPAPTPEAPTVAAPAAVSEDEVRQRVLALVAAQTGYPEDMLDLDLDLEADLGVDTVKQAELFATVREVYGIAREDTLQLRDFPTLNHVIAFALDRAGAPATAPPAVAAPTPEAPTVAAPAAVSEDEVRQRVLALVAAQTGYPEDMLDLDLDLEADLGVDTVKQAELFATVREVYGIAREDTLQLRDFPTLNHVIAFALDRAGAPAPAETAVPAPAPEDPAVAAPAPVAVSEDEVRQRVLALVAAQTGYPEDMLDLDLDLEADLGVDTVKQAELFATVREVYGIAREDTLQLRDFPTLNHVIAFALDRAGAPVAAETAPPTVPAETATVSPEALSGLDQCDQVPRRVPTAVLRPPVELCRPTGVTLAAGSRVVVMPDRAGVADALVERLHQRGVDTLVLDRPADPGPGGHDVDSEALVRQLQDWTTAGGAVTGVYWLAALDVEPPIAELDLQAWKEGLRVRVKLLAATMRALYDQVNVPGSFLVSATRLGGRHGYDEAGATAPMGGAVTGFTKAYKRERADAHVKAVDLEATTAATDVADILLEETLRDPGAVEVGRHGGLRWTVGFEERPAADGRPGFPLSPDTVFMVSGAAGGIVSAIVADLATASGGTFHLLDLAPEPDPGDPDLERFQTDRDGLKRDLFRRIKERGERATPAMVERELSALERQRAALDAIVAIRKAGGEAHYHRLDLRDPEAVDRAIDDVRRRHGRVDVLLHAAGLEISRFLPDKTDDEYDLVFDVKSDGWFNLLHAIGDMPLGATVCFSSVAARFGNGGQTDYSAANDLLCKTTSSLRTTRPATRGIVIDWSAWAGIGMATRGSIPKMMELAGIDMLPTDAGVPWARRELVTGGFRGEVLVGQRLGILVEEPDASLDRLAGDLPHGPMVGDVMAMGVWRPLTVETTLDPTTQAFLDHHRIDGTPVLPGAMGVEAFAEVASLMLPGWQVTAVEDVDFLAPFKFYRDQPRALTLEATVTEGTGDELVAHCRLLGSRQLAKQPEPQVSTHFTGRVRLSPAAPEPSTAAVPSAPQQGGVGAEAIYRVYFHGPAYQVLERSWREGDCQVGLLADSLPEHHQPPALPLVTAPRLLELCFQTAGVWELGTSGRLALPRHLGRVTVMAAGEPPTGRVFAVVTPGAGGETFDAMVVDEAGRVHLRLEGYATVALPTPLDAALLAPLRPEVT